MLGPLIEQVLAETYRVTRVTNGAAGLVEGLRGAHEVMVIDRRLPGLDGVSLVHSLRQERVTAPILMLTALGTVRDKVGGLDAGANDYLVKPFDFEELLARLRALRRVFETEGAPIMVGTWRFYPDSRTAYPPYGGHVILSEREAELLAYLAAQPARTFTREQILAGVFSLQERPSTVDTYVHYVRRKTDPAIITTVRGAGYRLGAP